MRILSIDIYDPFRRSIFRDKYDLNITFNPGYGDIFSLQLKISIPPFADIRYWTQDNI